MFNCTGLEYDQIGRVLIISTWWLVRDWDIYFEDPLLCLSSVFFLSALLSSFFGFFYMTYILEQLFFLYTSITLIMQPSLIILFCFILFLSAILLFIFYVNMCLVNFFLVALSLIKIVLFHLFTCCSLVVQIKVLLMAVKGF